MDNAPYHHKREFKSFSALKNKSELIEEMVKAGVKEVTLPKNTALPHQQPTSDADVAINEESEWKEWTNEKTKKKYYNNSVSGQTQSGVPLEGVYEKEAAPPPNGRNDDLRIELGKEIASQQSNTNTVGDIELAETRETAKYYYAQTGRRGTDIPTTDELKEACILEIKRMKDEEGTDLLKCAVQELLDEAGHELLWTPAYTPWLQPIEVRLHLSVSVARANWWC